MDDSIQTSIPVKSGIDSGSMRVQSPRLDPFHPKGHKGRRKGEKEEKKERCVNGVAAAFTCCTTY